MVIDELDELSCFVEEGRDELFDVQERKRWGDDPALRGYRQRAKGSVELYRFALIQQVAHDSFVLLS